MLTAQVLLGTMSAILPPAVAALSLGIVGRRLTRARISRNECFNHAGTFVAAVLAGAFGHYLGQDRIFYLVCVFAVASAAVVGLINPREVDHELARGGEDPDKSCEPVAVWPGLHAVLVVETIRSVNGTAKTVAELRYFLTSGRDAPEVLARAIRKHWI